MIIRGVHLCRAESRSTDANKNRRKKIPEGNSCIHLIAYGQKVSILLNLIFNLPAKYIVIHHACQWSNASAYLLSAVVTRLRSSSYERPRNLITSRTKRPKATHPRTLPIQMTYLWPEDRTRNYGHISRDRVPVTVLLFSSNIKDMSHFAILYIKKKALYILPPPPQKKKK